MTPHIGRLHPGQAEAITRYRDLSLSVRAPRPAGTETSVLTATIEPDDDDLRPIGEVGEKRGSHKKDETPQSAWVLGLRGVDKDAAEWSRTLGTEVLPLSRADSVSPHVPL